MEKQHLSRDAKLELYRPSNGWQEGNGPRARTGGALAPSSARLVFDSNPRSLSRCRDRTLALALAPVVAIVVTIWVTIYISCYPRLHHGLSSVVQPDSPHGTSPPLNALQQRLAQISLIISMVSTRWGGLAARAAFFISTHLNDRRDVSAGNTLDAIRALQNWYNRDSGLWTTTGWWNSANCLTVLADWAQADPSSAGYLGIPDTMATTFTNAQLTRVTTEKTLSIKGMPTSIYSFHQPDKRAALEPRGFSGFINEFYDDEGWWALGWIRSWDVTQDKRYLDMAEQIFGDMKNGTDGVCGGGVWWSKEKKYKNAIANELYLSVAASLANRLPGKKAYYLKIAQDEWAWFRASGMINPDNLINDGLVIQPDGRCVNNKLNTWSYNQGVVLGGLVELSRASGDTSYLATASTIANAAIRALSDAQGVIHEIDRCEPDCGDDGSQFKGIFMRNLHYLQKAAPQESFRRAIALNADSIWQNDRDERNQLGIDWSGPPAAGKGPTAGTHSSACDVLVADISV